MVGGLDKKKAGPAKASPGKSSDKKAGPAKGSPGKSSDKKAGPAKGSPGKSSDKKTTPAKSSPGPSKDKKTEPAKTSLGASKDKKTEPAKTSPGASKDKKAEPAKSSSGASKDKKTEPAKSLPGASKDKKTEPAKSSPGASKDKKQDRGKSKQKQVRGKLCATRELFADNVYTYVKRSLIELIFYVLFLATICVVAYWSLRTDAPQLTNLYRELFVDKVFTVADLYQSTFRQITVPQEYYWFVKTVVRGGLEGGYVAKENVLVGHCLMRQVAVKRDSCKVNALFGSHIESCSAAHSSKTEATDTLLVSAKDSELLAHKTAADLLENSHRGMLSTYSGGGFVKPLPDNEQAIEALFDMTNSAWLSQETRAIFVDFVTYNPNMDLFCFVRLLCEFSPTAGVITSAQVRAMPLLEDPKYGKILFGVECGIYVFIFWFILQELTKLMNTGLKYFLRVWNYTDIAVIVSACFMGFYRLQIMGKYPKTFQAAFTELSTVYHFRDIFHAKTAWETCMALLVFFAWIKFFRFCDVTEATSEAMIALNASIGKLCGFAAMFFVAFMAFVHAGHMLFGHYIEGFSTFTLSVYTMFLMTVGDFDISVLNEANSFYQPFFFFLFVFIILFFLINVFASILIEMFHATRTTDAVHARKLYLLGYLKLVFKGLPFGKWSKEKKKMGFDTNDIDSVVMQFRLRHPAGSLQEMDTALDNLVKIREATGGRNVSDVLVDRLQALGVNLSQLDAKLDPAERRMILAKKRMVTRELALIKLVSVILEVKFVTKRRRRDLLAVALKQEYDRLKLMRGDAIDL